ncbi:MAG: DUF521 domain-containing protein [Firmicutes bacterium]|nr:DUF521 domain-containing protein [Bacillota bacterium]
MAFTLNEWQRRAREGEFGEPVEQAMGILMELADFWGAERLIPIRKVHMPGASAKTARRAGRKYIKWCADMGARFVTTTTLNPGAADLTGIDIGVTRETMAQQMEITESYSRMGGIKCHTCTPYLVGNLPRFGEHVAWGESSAVVFANSVLGARTNREGGPAALASALTGYTVEYGLHLDENRIATVQVEVTEDVGDTCEYGSVGYFVAKRYPDAVPVFTGLPARIPQYGLKAIGAALASSGSVSMFHAVGLTPEAPVLEAATRGGKLEKIVAGKKELEETRRFLDRNDQEDVDCVFLGCPHLDYEEIIRISGLLAGRKVSSRVALWLFAANSTWQSCERSGLTRVLTEAGAQLISDTCPSITMFKEIMASKGFKSAATNSGKLAHYLPVWGMPTHFGPTIACLEAAVSGKWRP